MTEKIYPTLPTAPSMNSPDQFHADTVKKYYDDLINLRNKYKPKLEKYLRKREKLSNTSTSASVVSILAGASAVGSSFTVVGISVGAALSGIATLLTTSIGKFELLISKSLTDGFIIDSNEFGKLQGMYFEVMNDIRNRDYKMKVTIEKNNYNTIMEELKNQKKKNNRKKVVLALNWCMFFNCIYYKNA